MKIVAIIIGKSVLLIGKILKRGSSLPGKIALKIDKKLLSKITYPKIRIAITGSSGKGSTSALIANVLKANNKTVCFNASGSNLDWGIATSIIKNSTIFGRLKTEYLVIEVDERFTKFLFKDLKPNYLIITNLTKDQPPRQINVDVVYEDILKSIPEETTIITTIDEPYLRNFSIDLNNPHIYYSIAKNNYSYKKQIFENLNTYYCPKCGHLLEYQYYNFETLGKYNCSKCSFKYEEPPYLGKKLDLKSGTIEIEKKSVKIGGNLLYHAYNTLAAYTTLRELKIPAPDIIDSLNKLNNVASSALINNDKIYYPISCKAENCTTFNQAIFKVIQDNRPKSIIIGWKEISRRYNHFDVSWLYDIEFELLNNTTVKTIYACGLNKKDIIKRLILAGIPESKLKTGEDIDDIKEKVIKENNEIVYGILNFDYIAPFIAAFKETLIINSDS